MRLLVFDDDAATGRLVVRVATMMGMEATAVTNADAFSQQLRSQPPQIIVLDLQLGETDGVTQLRLLAAQGYAGALILISGFDARVLATARLLGANLGLTLAGGLEKPLQVGELQQVLEHLKA